MAKPSTDPPSDDFWNETKENAAENYKRAFSSKRESFNAHTYLFPIDETEEFHDPFSDLSLFLARRVKREILREKNPSKWSRKIQTLLLKDILPDFTKRFPKYRLGNAALQKTWDKVLHNLKLIQNENRAMKPNGKLNIDFMIKENLKNNINSQIPKEFHPYNSAHNLAIKISECIAAVDGEREKLDELTQTIWSVQKHLVPPSGKNQNSPVIQYNQLDKLIVRLQLEAIAKNPAITRDELELYLKEKVEKIKQLERIRFVEDLTSSLSAILANKLYPSLSLHKNISREKIEVITQFIKKRIEKESSQDGPMSERARVQLVQRILFLYKLSSQINYAQAQQGLEAAIQYVY